MATSRIKVSREAAIKALETNKAQTLKEFDAETKALESKHDKDIMAYEKTLHAWLKSATKRLVEVSKSAAAIVDRTDESVYIGGRYRSAVVVEVDEKAPVKPSSLVLENRTKLRESLVNRYEQAVKMLNLSEQVEVTVAYDDIGRLL